MRSWCRRASPPVSRWPLPAPSSCGRLHGWPSPRNPPRTRAIRSERIDTMKSITDVFIKHPVLAGVVNLVLVLVGWRALASLPVQQYPQIESSSVVITTIYYGASAETVRGFLTTPIERVVSAIGGVD